jgi:aldehyde dehydrogenase (NAD+)
VRVRRDPLGVTLVIGAWNEPFMLVSAIAAGNTAVGKPSEVSKASAAVLAEMIPKFLDTDAVAAVTGGVPETTALLDQHWDLIFLTGSPAIGKIVHQAAAKHLTPTILELGGKNPTIVHSSAHLKSAAHRIAYGRFSNSGHICTAPDHVLVWTEVKDEFVAHLKEAIHDFYGEDPKKSPDYGRIINRRSLRPPGWADLEWHRCRGWRDRRRRALHRADGTRRRPGRLADHAGGGLRPDPASTRDRLSRCGGGLGQ